MRLLLFILLSIQASAQNLIPNPSFESPIIDYTEQLTTSGNYVYNSSCTTTSGGVNMDYWWVYAYYPERIWAGTQPNCRDNDAAQDGSSYLMLQNSDLVLVTLLDTLEVGCLYQFTCYMNLETFRGASSNPSVMMFFTDYPAGNTIQSPIIYFNLWQQFSVPFVATAASTVFEFSNWVFNTGLQIDNVSIIKVGCPLPISLDGFVARPYRENVILSWTTRSEINNDHFEIQRKESEWKTIGIIDGSGNSTSPVHYEYTDKNPISGTNYYRLKQVDYDGKFTFSSIVVATIRMEACDYYNLMGIKINNPIDPGVYIMRCGEISKIIIK